MKTPFIINLLKHKWVQFAFMAIFGFTIPMAAQDDDDVIFDEADSISVITHENYLKNPGWYLRYIDSTKIPTGILIDRVKFRKDLKDFNGKSRVKTGDYGDFWKVIYTLQEAANDLVWFPNFDTLYKVAYHKMRWKKIQPISVLNYSFSKLNHISIENDNTMVTDSALFLKNLTDSMLSDKDAFLASTYNFRVHGDVIPFVFYQYNYFTNQLKDTVEKIEANFGKGWVTFEWNMPQEISFKEKTGYIEIKVRFTLRNIDNEKQRKLIAHFTVLRSGSDLVPNPNLIIKSTLKSTAPPCSTYYFKNYDLGPEQCIPLLNSFGQVYYECFRELIVTNTPIEYNIVWGKDNESKKLRKPLIVCDGFDPGDKRDFFETFLDDPDGTLEKSKDTRGIYQLINGDPSPWYKDSQFPNYNATEANLAGTLYESKYDLVVVNFLDGAGDINKNAYWFRRFLKEEINGSLRDNQTEENVIIGPSMGGLITRIALDSTELLNEEHHVREWFSFDSPQEGAYIPIALQYAIRYMYYILDIKDDGILSGAVHKNKLKLQRIIDKALNSIAAKQMMLLHYDTDWRLKDDQTYTVYPTVAQDRIPFTQQLAKLGYPKFSRNIAISNGGTQMLYTDNSVNIIKFNAEDFRMAVVGDRTINGLGTSFLFNGEYDGYGSDVRFNIDNNIGYEVAPGGWHSALYDLNCDWDANEYNLDARTTRFAWACFMVTASAFGVPITKYNVYKYWTDFQNDPTLRAQVPFDDIYGMTGMNQEHVHINTSTGKRVKEFLETEDLVDIQRPRISNRSSLAQSISGPLKLKGTTSVTLGGSSSFTYTLSPGADLNIAAGTRIVFKPGTKALKGAKLKAKTGTTAILKSAESNPVISQPAKYPNNSPYSDKVTSYSEKTETGIILNQVNSNENAISIFPNPSNGVFQVSLNNDSINSGNIFITNILGNKVYSNLINNRHFEINLNDIPEGLYFVTLKINGKLSREKILIKK